MEIKFQSNVNNQIKTRSTDGLLPIIRYLDRLYDNSIEYFDGVITFDLGIHTDLDTIIEIDSHDITANYSVENYICKHLAIILQNIANENRMPAEMYSCGIPTPNKLNFTPGDTGTNVAKSIGIPHTMDLFSTDVHCITHPVALYIFILFREIMGVPVSNGID